MSKAEQEALHGATRWWQLLDAQLAHTTAADVARTMGVSRPYIARVRSGSISTPSPLFVSRVLAAFDRVQCPHLQHALKPTECAAFATRAYGAVTGPDQLKHWRTCQKCPHHPTTGCDNLMHGPQAVRPVVVTKLDKLLAARQQRTAATPTQEGQP
jgi:hypothetical protein